MSRIGVVKLVSLLVLVGLVFATTAVFAGDPKPPPAAPHGPRPQSPSSPGLVFSTAADNEDNARTGAPDGDMGGATPPCVYDADAIHPIEFNIFVTGVSGSPAATLEIDAYDVDLPGEVDVVKLNGTTLGDLTGGDDVYSTTSFNIPAGLLVTTGAGKNTVEIIVDENPPGTNKIWCVEIYEGRIIVPEAVPTLTEWGMIALFGLFTLALGAMVLRRRLALSGGA